MIKMVIQSSNTASTEVGGKDSPLERFCDNGDCNVNKLVSMVPKRKTAQFVTEPCVIDKPMLVNGFTTIFQVDGAAAKISDLRKRVNGNVKTIYRIIPNTHSHIVNYVVVDTEGESLRKINNGDPTTMKKLLDSQRISAEQMLGKLMKGQGAYLKVANTTVANGTQQLTTIRSPNLNKKLTTTTTSPPAATTTTTSTMMNSLPVINTTTTVTPMTSSLGSLSRMPATTIAKLPMRSVTIKKIGTTPATSTTMTLPTLATSTTVPTVSATTPILPNNIRFNSSIKVRAYPSKKPITSTPIASSLATTTTTSTSTASASAAQTVTRKRNNLPLIKTVPLSQLQEQPPPPLAPLAPAPPAVVNQPEVPVSPIAASTTAAPTDNSIFEKMQKELEDLRRTVALLAETQKKSLSATITVDEPTIEEPQSKKPKL